MRWFKPVKLLTSHQNKAEFMELRRINAILDTKVANVQSVGVMSDGDRQYFPL